MKNPESLQKRACERRPACMVVKFPHNNATCYGIVKNISEKGMCINSGVCLPSGSVVELIIPLKKEELLLPVNVRWIAKTGDFYDAMGIEVLQPSEKYLKIVESFSQTP